MRLIKAEVRNFKLLEDISVRFSTDQKRPLTVIRAENGSGKTSLLYALLWGFYGMAGLPENARSLRLTSSASKEGVAIQVSVMIEFEHTGDVEELSRYRLLRSVIETPSRDDKVTRENEQIRLMQITDAGEKDVSNAEALIGKLVPLRLRDIFFTNGDDVQRFISGKISSRQRQDQVHKCIRALLGLDALRTARDDIDAAFRRLRAEAAKSGGADTTSLEEALEATDDNIVKLRTERDEANSQITNMEVRKASWDKELNNIRGIGDLDQLNSRIENATTERDLFESARNRALVRMREAVRSEACSWGLQREKLRGGLDILSDLADRNVIPGTAIEVLRDRLDIGECICGESLSDGSPHRNTVETLISQQEQVSVIRQRLTELYHVTRQSDVAEQAREQAGETFDAVRRQLLQEFVEARDSLVKKAAEVDVLKERRALIDEERVKDLTTKLSGVEGKLADVSERLGGLNARLDILQSQRELENEKLKQVEKAAKLSGSLVVKRDLAGDLLGLATGTLDVLEGDYVQRVSTRMRNMFMNIVGSDEAFEASIFTGVHIDEGFNIVVDTHGGKQLDTDFEVNGASQRALTLAFIWSLMEVSGTTAPRIIDSPLGMVAGGVKTRMVDAITCPSDEAASDFQVVLFLTRSEIRDIEELLDDRAGVSQTLSCSSQYPEDLVHSWEVDHPLSKACSCDHRHSCRICARQYDHRHGIEYLESEAVI